MRDTPSKYWIQTGRGAFYYDDLENSDIFLADIIESICRMVRYTGHAGDWTVGQHSLLCYELARGGGYGVEDQKAALIHDFHEAYTGDVNSPLGRYLNHHGNGVWKKFHDAVQSRVWKELGVTASGYTPGIVRAIDVHALNIERHYLLPPTSHKWGVPDTKVTLEDRLVFKTIRYLDRATTGAMLYELCEELEIKEKGK